jgi:hypothetical protein
MASEALTCGFLGAGALRLWRLRASSPPAIDTVFGESTQKKKGSGLELYMM